MNTSKYGSFLTIILIVLIIAILIGTGLLIFNYVIKPNIDRNQKIEAIAEFDRNINIEEDDDNNEENNQQLVVEAAETSDNQTQVAQPIKKYFYKGFPMLGYITIPKTNVKEPILETASPKGLDLAVEAIYPINPKLNEPGNVVIIGHNYRNGTFFSNNKKLTIGDKIQIKDNSGKELIYTIYQKFQTTENDTSFYNRNTNGAIEITLSTCTDDSKERIIILAKVE